MDGPRKRLFLDNVEMLRQCFPMKMTFKWNVWVANVFFGIFKELCKFEDSFLSNKWVKVGLSDFCTFLHT